MKTSLKKNDVVMVLTGKDKGKTGKILRFSPDKKRVFVEKLNIVKKHMKPSQANPAGGIIEKEASVALSNLVLNCKKCDKGVRIGSKLLDDGSKVRVCRKCGEII